MTKSERASVSTIHYKRRLLAALSPLCRTIGPYVQRKGTPPPPNPEFKPVRFHDQEHLSNFDVSRASIDIENSGRKISVWLIGGYTPAFTGEYLLAFLLGTAKSKSALIDYLKRPEGYKMSDMSPLEVLLRWGAALINFPLPGPGFGGTSNRPVVYDHKTYIYSHQTVESDLQVPYGLLTMIEPNGAVKTICTYP